MHLTFVFGCTGSAHKDRAGAAVLCQDWDNYPAGEVSSGEFGRGLQQAVAKTQAGKRVLLLLSNRGMSRYAVLRWR